MADAEYAKLYLKGLISLCREVSLEGNGANAHDLANCTQSFQSILDLLERDAIDSNKAYEILRGRGSLDKFKAIVRRYEKRKE